MSREKNLRTRRRFIVDTSKAIWAVKILTAAEIINFLCSSCDTNQEQEQTNTSIENFSVVEYLQEKEGYEPYLIRENETFLSISNKLHHPEITWKNVYSLLDSIVDFNKKHPIQENMSPELSFEFNPQKNKDTTHFMQSQDSTNVEKKLPSMHYVWMPKFDELKLTEEEQKRKDNYKMLFEGKDDINITKYRKRGTLKIDSVDQVKNTLLEYQKKLKADGYDLSYFEIRKEFQKYNERFYTQYKNTYGEYAANQYYNGSNTDLVAWTTVQLPLYKHVTPKTVVNDLTEKEKYSGFDSQEKAAFIDLKKKILEKHDDENPYTGWRYTILVNTLKPKGKHQVVLCDLETNQVVRRYICSTWDEPGRYHSKWPKYTPKGIFQLGEKLGENFPRGIIWDKKTGYKPEGRPVPMQYDMDGNFKAGRQKGGASMDTRLIRLALPRIMKDDWTTKEAQINFHGTNMTDQLGYFASGGCIRMDAKDVLELFELVKTGGYVNIMAPREYQDK